MQAQEHHDGILSISFAHGFPWGDVPQASAKVLVIADGDLHRAQQTAEHFGQRLWSVRHEAIGATVTVEQAMSAIQQVSEGPVILADVSDNAGGGAPSDATFLLQALLDHNISDVVSGYYWDPLAVRFCQEAGLQACLDLRIGGKCGPTSGMPIDLRVTV